MTPITPEDREIWDKKMKAHDRRLKKRESRLKTLFIGAFCALVMITALNIAWRWYSQPYTPARTPEMILDDTLQINQGKIPDSLLWSDSGPSSAFLDSFQSVYHSYPFKWITRPAHGRPAALSKKRCIIDPSILQPRRGSILIDDTISANALNSLSLPHNEVIELCAGEPKHWWTWERVLMGPDSGLIRVTYENAIIAQKRPGQPWETIDTIEWSRPAARYAEMIMGMFKAKDSL